MTEKVSLQRIDNVFVIQLCDSNNDNRLDIEFVSQFHTALDHVELFQGDCCVVVTGDDHKTFCTGLNLNWFGLQSGNKQSDFVAEVDRLLLRLALFSAPTIACLNGNAYGAGAILASACDFRFMRQDKGRFCLPAVNIGIIFTPVMSAVIGLLPNPHSVKTLMLTGSAISAEECYDQNIVDDLWSKEMLFSETVGFAKMMSAKDRHTYVGIRNQMRTHLEVFREHL